MDSKTRYILEKLHTKAPQHLKDALVALRGLEPDEQKMVEELKAALATEKDPAYKEEIKKSLVEFDDLSKRLKGMTPEQEEELSNWYQSEIAKLLKDGKIPPPPETDDFRKEIGLLSNETPKTDI